MAKIITVVSSHLRFVCLPQNFHGLVQRLISKEKQVLQLQAELDRFKAENPNEGREAVSFFLLL